MALKMLSNFREEGETIMNGLGRCAALDMHGKQCKATKDTFYVRYHGDTEIYPNDGPKPQWVRVVLCPKHVSIRFQKRKARR